MPRLNPQSPYAQVLTSTMGPKADGGRATSLMAALGVKWNAGEVAWNLVNPHPNFYGSWPIPTSQSWPPGFGRFEFAFNYARYDEERTMIHDHLASAGLNELLFFYPGSIDDASADDDLQFEPMISLGNLSGAIPWSEVTSNSIQRQRQPNPRTGRMEIVEQPERSQITGEDLVILRDNPSAAPNDQRNVLAAQIRGKGSSKTNAIVICDLDFVSELFYDQEAALGQKLDNLRLLQNSIEVLAGETGFLALRNRRPKTRTLETVESQIEEFRKLRTAEQKKKEDLAREEVEKIQMELAAVADEINENKDLNFIQKMQMATQSSMDAETRFERRRQVLERDLKRDVDLLKAREQLQISGLETRYRALATLLAPLPALLLGLVVFGVRSVNENREVRTRR
jgi:ABC-2 type transport system permease protein